MVTVVTGDLPIDVVGDPLEVSVDIVLFPPPDDTPISISSDVGAIFTGSVGVGGQRDRERIESLGFTIVEEIPKSGTTDFVAFGDADALVALEEERNNLITDISFVYFSLPSGNKITPAFILNSNDL